MRAFRWIILAALLAGLLGAPAAAGGQTKEPAYTWAAGEPAPGDLFAPGRVLVRFAPGVESSAELFHPFAASFLTKLYGSPVEVWQVPDGSVLQVVEHLKAQPGVVYVEPDYVYSATGVELTPNDPSFANQWGHTRMNSTGAWDYTTGSNSVVIAIIDTGIDETHPDLAGKIVAGYDYVDGDSNPHDTNGHGTHVAGISAAATNNSIGVAGTSWQSPVMALRVLGTTGSGTSSAIVNGINFAYQNGAKVLNMSLGGSSYSQTMQDAVNAAHGAGKLVVAAMGNNNSSTPAYPAAYTNVMAVSATGPTDTKASYSNYGSHCDISAPGGDMGFLHDPNGILSTMPTYSVYLNTQYGYSQNYDTLNGTSQASPYVAGVAALIFALNPALTPDQVQTAIQSTATDLGAAGWDQYFGWGRVNAAAAVQVYGVPAAPALASISNPDDDGSYPVDWNDVSGATSYTLEEDDNAGFGSPVVKYSGSTSQFNVTGQTAGTWYYRVKAHNGVGGSNWSNVVSVRAGPAVPALANISNPDGDGNYTVDWNDVPNTTSYTLEEDDNGGFTSPTTRYSGGTSQFNVTGQAGGAWYYRVKAANSAGTNGWSNVVYIYVAPSAPALSAISNPSNGDAYIVNWTAPAGATGYTLEEDDNPGFSSPAVRYMGTANSYAVTGQPGGIWYYRARASNPGGNSPYSGAQSTSVTKSRVPTPNLQPISNGDNDGNYTVDWSDVVTATGYTLEQANTPYFNAPQVVYSGSTSQFVVSGHGSGVWYYRVRAAAATGSSPWSGAQSATTTGKVFVPGMIRKYAAAPTWNTITSMDFEGAFPGGWALSDSDGTANGEYLFAKSSCAAFAGTYSGWGVGGGANGSGLSCGANYPPYAESYMVYGPFSLVGASAADLNFKLWINTEASYDYLCRLASLDGVNFSGTCTSGVGNWMDRVLDLSNVYNLGNLLGQSQVWVALLFSSDFSNEYSAGAYVDNIVLRRFAASDGLPPDPFVTVTPPGVEEFEINWERPQATR
jgi:hypothetical protein